MLSLVTSKNSCGIIRVQTGSFGSIALLFLLKKMNVQPNEQIPETAAMKTIGDNIGELKRSTWFDWAEINNDNNLFEQVRSFERKGLFFCSSEAYECFTFNRCSSLVDTYTTQIQYIHTGTLQTNSNNDKQTWSLSLHTTNTCNIFLFRTKLYLEIVVTKNRHEMYCMPWAILFLRFMWCFVEFVKNVYYMITTNIDAADGLVSGAVGKLVHIDYDNAE